MTPSAVLQEKLQEARIALLTHPQWHLDPFWRNEIYVALAQAEVPDVLSAQRAADLAIRTARRVLPIWEAGYPNDTLPQRLLVEALLRPAESEGMGKSSTLLADSFDDLAALSTEDQSEVFQRRICVGMAANAALRIAVTGRDAFVELFRLSQRGHALTEPDIDPYVADAAHWAAMAAAYFPWSPDFNRHQSRDFWLWWLDECVPESCRLPS